MPRPAIEVHARRRQPLGMPPARFLRDYWQKRPLLIRGAFPDFMPPLSPDELAGLACMEGAIARIVAHKSLPNSSFRTPRSSDPAVFAGSPTRTPKAARRASAMAGASQPSDFKNTKTLGSRFRGNDEKWKVLTGPFDDATFARLPKSNWTLLVQDVDKWDAGTAALLATFAFIPSWRIDDVMISYATDRGGVGAHVDQYDVFLLQGSGRRRWAIDTRPDPPTAFRSDVELKLLQTFHPTHEWVLDPGDMLYLPPGVPHDGVALGECTTYSIGMRAPAVGELLLDFAAQVAESLPESRRFADPDLKPAGDAGEIDDVALRRARSALGPVAGMLDDDAFADWFGRFITRYRVAQVPAPRRRPIDRGELAERLRHSMFERDPWSRFAWRRHGRAARLYVAGNAFDVALAWARELAGNTRVLDGARLARLPGHAGGIELLAKLADAGYLRMLPRERVG